MVTKIEMVGQRFGKQLVLKYAGAGKQGTAMWLVRCECGSPDRVVRGDHLRGGQTSCRGCSPRRGRRGSRRRIDLTGHRFGKVTVLEYVGWSRATKAMWLVRCDCGDREWVARSAHLRSGGITSCHRRECPHSNWGKGPHPKHGHSSRANGKKWSPEYTAWMNMRTRCLNPENRSYRSYGGRGITVCARWVDDFEAFLSDLGPRPSAEHSLDRKDNDGNYEPGNVRWVLTKFQGRNKLSTPRVTWLGKSHSLADWAEILELSYPALRGRHERGWTPERMFATPVKHHQRKVAPS